MRQIFIVAVLAACSMADEFEDIKAALTGIAEAECRECVIQERAAERRTELEREADKFVRDLKCWWEERNGGVSGCSTTTEPVVMQLEEVEPVDECKMMEVRDWGEMCIYENELPWVECVNSSDEAIWDGVSCYENEQAQIDACEKKGGEWGEILEGWDKLCYIKGEDPWLDCQKSSTNGEWMNYDWETGECKDAREACEDDGYTWDDEWDFCEYWNEDQILSKRLGGSKRYSNMMRNLAHKPEAQRILATYSAQFNIPQLEEITKPVEEGEKEGEQLVQDMMAEWGPKLEDWYVAQQAREQKAFEELTQVILDSVSVDGKSLRDMMQQPVEGAVMSKKLRNAKSVRSFVMQETDQPQNVKITFEGPNQQELEEWLGGLQMEVEAIGSSLGQIAEEYGRKYEDLNEQLEDALEPVGEDVEDLVDRVGDDLKKITDSATTEFYALAMKKAKSAAAASANKKKSNGFYYGMASGAMGVFAATALFAACKSKKKIQANEETLL